jgi:colicin import membrane protein
MTERTPTLEIEESIPTIRITINGETEPPFHYGWRYVCRVTNGREEWEQVPLTEEDVLHPQMDDYIVQSHMHQCICHYLYTVLRSRMKHIPGGLVLHDVGVEWGVPGIRHHAPDLAVFAGVWEPPWRGKFDLKASGGRVLLAIEVTSPSTRHLDVASPLPEARTRFRHYAQVGIPLYILVDEARRASTAVPPPIFGYELTEDGYQPLLLDEQGRLWVPPVGMWLGPSGGDVVWFDADGRRIWDYDEEQEARRSEQQARLAAEARAQELERKLRQMQGKPGAEG